MSKRRVFINAPEQTDPTQPLTNFELIVVNTPNRMAAKKIRKYFRDHMPEEMNRHYWMGRTRFLENIAIGLYTVIFHNDGDFEASDEFLYIIETFLSAYPFEIIRVNFKTDGGVEVSRG